MAKDVAAPASGAIPTPALTPTAANFCCIAEAADFAGTAAAALSVSPMGRTIAASHIAVGRNTLNPQALAVVHSHIADIMPAAVGDVLSSPDAVAAVSPRLHAAAVAALRAAVAEVTGLSADHPNVATVANLTIYNDNRTADARTGIDAETTMVRFMDVASAVCAELNSYAPAIQAEEALRERVISSMEAAHAARSTSDEVDVAGAAAPDSAGE